MTFSDIFSESFLEGFNQDISVVEMIIVMSLGLVIGIFIYFIYKKTFQGVLYSKNFSTSLILLTMITAAAVMTIKSQIVLSLGMVGALSIVRFRAAIKSPMDIVFMFWAITAGIISGAGLYVLAISTSVILGIVTYVIYLLRNGDRPYMLMVNFNDDSIEEDVINLIKGRVKRFNLKGRIVTAGAVELSIELRLKEGESRFINDLQKVKGVQSANLVSFSGDYSA